jgi:hypothetical protein
VPNRFACVGSGEHGYHGGYPQIGQSVRMCGVVGREIDREAGLDGRNDEAPVFDSDRIIAEDRLVGEGDRVFVGVGGDELVEERAVDLGPVTGEVACLGIPLQTARPERCDLGAKLRPGSACEAAGYSIPVRSESAGFGVAAIFVERAARPA